MDLKPHTIYYYKVARLNSAMIEQEQSQPIKSGTTFYRRTLHTMPSQRHLELLWM